MGKMLTGQEEEEVEEGIPEGGGEYVKVLLKRPQINQFSWSGKFCQEDEGG